MRAGVTIRRNTSWLTACIQFELETGSLARALPQHHARLQQTGNPGVDLLAAFELPSGASRDEIEAAWRRMRSKLHPDKVAGFEQLSAPVRKLIEREFDQLQKAYTELMQRWDRAWRT